MKTSDYALLLGAAMVLLYVVKKTAMPAAAATPANTYGATEINVGDSANGWRYFTDGTAIGPDGKYYKNDQLVYDPTGMYKL